MNPPHGSDMERLTVPMPSQMRRELRALAAVKLREDGRPHSEAELARIAIRRLLKAAERKRSS